MGTHRGLGAVGRLLLVLAVVVAVDLAVPAVVVAVLAFLAVDLAVLELHPGLMRCRSRVVRRFSGGVRGRLRIGFEGGDGLSL